MRSFMFLALMSMMVGIFLASCAGAATKIASGSVLFSDDFSDVKAAWGLNDSTAGKTAFGNGEFHISVKIPNVFVWSVPKTNFKDARIEVDLIQENGPENSVAGLICRFVDKDNYYMALISANGKFNLSKFKGGNESSMMLQGWQADNSIQTSMEKNHLRLDCVGDKIRFYANSHILTQIVDRDFDHGDIGLIAGDFNQAGAMFAFDNIKVIQP